MIEFCQKLFIIFGIKNTFKMFSDYSFINKHLIFQEDWLADSFNVFLDYSLQLIRKYRKLFPPHHHMSMNRLEYILR